MRRVLLSALVVGTIGLGVGINCSQAGSFNPDPVFRVGPISDTTSHQIAKLDVVASKLAGRHTTVNCWSEDSWTKFQAWQSTHHDYAAVDASGVTWFKTHHIELSPFVCQVIAQILAKPVDQPLWDAAAITVVAHESAHASGIRAENLAECRAIETEPAAAALLGVPRSLGRRFQHIYRGTLYPRESSRYNRPSCRAGLPGIVAPDTFGQPSALHRLERSTSAAVRSLPHWPTIGGSYDFGPLSRCGLVRDRSHELARFNETFLGKAGAFASVEATAVRTRDDFEFALERLKALPRCALAEQRARDHEDGSNVTVALGRVPGAIHRLSPAVHAVRFVYASHGRRHDVDTIFVMNRATRSGLTLYFGASTGAFSLPIEVKATKAVLRAYR